MFVRDLKNFYVRPPDAWDVLLLFPNSNNRRHFWTGPLNIKIKDIREYWSDFFWSKISSKYALGPLGKIEKVEKTHLKSVLK